MSVRTIALVALTLAGVAPAIPAQRIAGPKFVPLNPAPTGVTAVADPKGVLISWAAAAGSTGYVVLRSADAVTFAALGPPNSATSYLDTGVVPGTTVYYQVTAVFSIGPQATAAPVSYSAPVMGGRGLKSVAVARLVPATVPQQSPPVPTANAGLQPVAAFRGATPTPIPPGPAPSNLRALPSTPVAHTIAWNATTGATGYSVQRLEGRASGQWQQVTTAPITQLQWTEQRWLDPSDTHTYRVTALQASGAVGYADLSYTPPPMQAPSGLSGQRIGAGPVSLRWTGVVGATGYHVFGPGVPVAGVLVGGTSYTVANVPIGPQTFRVSTDYASVFSGAILAQTTVIPTAPITAKYASLNPAVNGFRFVNNFDNSFIGPPINMRTNGLCGGMSYAVLDYYNAGRAIPNQTYRPANGTTIQQYLYGRQVTSLMDNLDKWAELTVNPLGSRNGEFFNWGISGRLQEIKSAVDRGVAVPLGLKGFSAGFGGDHQVLAIGYDLGRYQLDLGNYQTDVKIFILDPNYPTETLTLVPDPSALVYRYVQHPAKTWRTYFVDGKYQPMTPPNIVNPVYPNDGLVHELRFVFETGADDMRGGADHVDLTVRLSNNTSLVFQNISQNGIWLSNYVETAAVVLPQPIAEAMITAFEISTNATGGVGGDNWDLRRLQRVDAIGGGFSHQLLSQQAGPFRFTGARIPMVVFVR